MALDIELANWALDEAKRKGASAAEVLCVTAESLDAGVRLGEVEKLKSSRERRLGLMANESLSDGLKRMALSQADLAARIAEIGPAQFEEIKTVLVQDPGFMVELKRWVAREETNEGQIVSESDLTDDAIFQRLETDVKFRSVATTLLQRYGYLVPKVNPFSEMAKEQDLLMQERVRWIAQEEAQQREAQAAFTEQMFELAKKCAQGDPQQL